MVEGMCDFVERESSVPVQVEILDDLTNVVDCCLGNAKKEDQRHHSNKNRERVRGLKTV